MAAPMIRVLESDTAVANEVCSFIIEKANYAINQKGLFTIGLSGEKVARKFQ